MDGTNAAGYMRALVDEVRRLRSRSEDLAKASERLIDCHRSYCSSFGPGMSDDAACAVDVRAAIDALAGGDDAQALNESLDDEDKILCTCGRQWPDPPCEQCVYLGDD